MEALSFPALLAGLDSRGDGVEAALLALNDTRAEDGLALSPGEVRELAEVRRLSLKETRRFEVGPGAVPELARRLARSSYVCREDYAGVLAGLTELFYEFKTEAEDRVDDDELMDVLFDLWEHRSGGTVEGLADCRDLWAFLRLVRDGDAGPEDGAEEEEEDFE